MSRLRWGFLPAVRLVAASSSSSLWPAVTLAKAKFNPAKIIKNNLFNNFPFLNFKINFTQKRLKSDFTLRRDYGNFIGCVDRIRMFGAICRLFVWIFGHRWRRGSRADTRIFGL